MLRFIVPGLCGLALSGCVSVLGPTAAPSCDGYSRRPLNPSMWNFEAAQAAVVPAPDPDVEGPTAIGRPAPRLRTGQATSTAPLQGRSSQKFDVAASMRPCMSERGHG